MADRRSAGILLHVTSLPTPFGIGDIGPEAKAFADFLKRSNQRFWQLLPLNPTEAGQGQSPYSSISSKAGNTLLISPEALAVDGWLDTNDLHQYYLPQLAKVDYEGAKAIKDKLFQQAWENFCKHPGFAQQLFSEFSYQEATWLDDFALYVALKEQHNGKPWFEWPDAYKHRQPEALQQFAAAHDDDIKKIKWLQFLFDRQWKVLKSYCNNQGVQLFGDLPFYISHDSADVWTQPEIFALDQEGQMTGIAGVPPDAFSDNGQLWGMPVFRWDVLKEQQYKWWIERFKKNMELYDIVRLDHFRAFADYWEVPAHSSTARNGVWKPGPGADLFLNVQQALGSLPFVAEDLGVINDAVYQLRDTFHLPGMKILQFAFGEDMATNHFAPHNYTQHFVVYTGTHDNNTLRGWYQEQDKPTLRRLEQYVGKEVTENDIVFVLCRMAYASVANTVILPVQDILGLNKTARMNTPSSSHDNWQWRLLPEQISKNTEDLLKEWTTIFNRK